MAKHQWYVTFGRRGIRDGFVMIVTDQREDGVRKFCRDEYGPCWSGLYDYEQWHADGGSERYYPAGQIGEVRL